MNPSLLAALREVEKAIRADLLAQYYVDPELKARALDVLRAEEASQNSPADIDAWLVTFAGRAATIYVLKTLYVRVLEDQELLSPPRIRDGGTYPLFAELFPHLGEDAYLRVVIEDASRLLPELFIPTPVEIAQPSAASARLLWDLWQEPRESGVPFDFSDELDTRFIGDLYQDLDPEVRNRYALLQTPRFVESFILDHTLTPALETFPLEAFRILDPTCGSGHFLLGAFERLAYAWRCKLGNPADPSVRWEAATRALGSVSGCDLNEYASALSRFRLLLGVVRETGVTDTTLLRSLHFDVITCDTLIRWETLVEQRRLDGTLDADWVQTYGTTEERERNVRFFARDFHAVVGNPPYKSVTDKKKREVYKKAWPRSASGKYTLSAPMMERFFTLPVASGRSGVINSNNFAKRSFGRGVVTKVLPDVQLDLVVDTSGAYLPGHGTPTVMIFTTRIRPAPNHSVPVVAGKRGEPSEPADPEKGLVWSAIVEHIDEPGYEDRFIAVSSFMQRVLCMHPWSLGSDAVTRIKEMLDSYPRVRDLGAEAGPAVIIIEDDAFFRCYSRGLPLRRVVVGEDVRDWRIADTGAYALSPYVEEQLVSEAEALDDLWPLRTALSNRPTFGGSTYKVVREPWWKFHQVTRGRSGLGNLRIVIGEQATNSHFVVDDSDAVFTQTAPVLTLREADEAKYRDVAAILNSSTLEFWFKQVCFRKGGDVVGSGRVPGEAWDVYYVRNGTNVVAAPIAASDRDRDRRTVVLEAISKALKQLAQNSPAEVISRYEGGSLDADLQTAAQQAAIAREQLVAGQEELDWMLYFQFGLIDVMPPLIQQDEPPTLELGHRPFEIVLSRRIDAGEETTTWYKRHEIERVSDLPAKYKEPYRNILEARIAAIERDEVLGILEQSVHKRRWQWPGWDEQVRDAAEAYIAKRLENVVRSAGPSHSLTVSEMTDILGVDPKVLAVSELLRAGGAVQLPDVISSVLDGNVVPDSPTRLFTASGLRKYLGKLTAGEPAACAPLASAEAADWKRIWRLQEREDRGDDVGELRPAPPFKKEDYAHRNGWQLRGKFNVPNERFIRYDDDVPVRYGWGGWSISERALASLHVLDRRDRLDDDAPATPTAESPARCALQFALWDKLDELRRTKDEQYPEVRENAELCRAVCPCPVLGAWQVGNASVRGRRRVVGANGSMPAAATIDRASGESAIDPAFLDALAAAVVLAGERGASASELATVAEGDETLLRRGIDALRARGAIVAIGRGRGTRYKASRQETLL